MKLNPIGRNQTVVTTVDGQIFFSYRTPVQQFFVTRLKAKTSGAQSFALLTSGHAPQPVTSTSG